MTLDTDTASVPLNSAARRALIRDTMEQVFAKDMEIEAAEELHVEPLKAERKKLWADCKTDAEIPLGVLKAHYKLVKMSRRDFEEEDDAAEFRDAMKETWEALEEGDQLDWLDSAEKAEVDIFGNAEGDEKTKPIDVVGLDVPEEDPVYDAGLRRDKELEAQGEDEVEEDPGDDNATAAADPAAGIPDFEEDEPRKPVMVDADGNPLHNTDA